MVTPLWVAASQGHKRDLRLSRDAEKLQHLNGLQLAVVTQLLDAGADPNMVHQGGATPLMRAAVHSDLAVVRLLLARGADAAAVLKGSGCTALHLARRDGRLDCAEELARAGRGAGARDNSNTPGSV